MKTTAIRKAIRKMAKETTTTFTVTVKHNGPQKDFETLFKNRRGICSTEATVESSETIKKAPVPMYTDDQKIGRKVFKDALEAAGLVYNGKNATKTDNTYELTYHYRGYMMHIKHARILADFPNGIGSDGTMNIQNVYNSYGYWESDRLEPIEYIINFATPTIMEDLAKIFKKWGTGNHPS